MPAKKIISKEMILIEAINLIEEEGTFYVVVDGEKREFYDVEEIMSLL